MIAELTRQEIIKVFAQRYIYVLVLVVLGVEAARMLGSALTPPETTLDVVTAPQVWAEGVGMGLRFGVYLLLVVGGMSIAQEFSLGTVKTFLVLPLQRWEWVGAKLLFLALFALALLAIVAALGWALVAVTLGWGEVTREGVVLHGAGAVWRNMLIATGLTGLFLLPVCAFALLVGTFFRSSGPAVGTALLLGIVLEVAVGLVDFGKYVFLFHLHRPVGIIEKMGKGLPFQWESILTWGVGTSLVTVAVFGFLVVWRLERMDITA